MNVINGKHFCKIKSLSIILLASLLFACQGESSAESVEAVVEKSSGVTTIASDSAPVAEIKEVVEETVQTVTETQTAVEAAVTPRPPADFSTLNASTYKPVTQQFAVSSGDKIEVTELFWFGCGHCFALEAPLKQWLKGIPENATFKKVPAIFSKRWEFHGKAFYTMEALNMPEKTYDDFFYQIHVKKKSINNLSSLIAYLGAYGKDEASVTSAFNSFAVDSKLRNAIKITQASGARGVPALVVDGKYITSQSDAGGTAQMFDVVDKLVAKAASER